MKSQIGYLCPIQMILTDTHIHLYAEEYEGDRNELITTAIDAGVRRFLIPNIDSTSVAGMLGLANSFPGICLPMLGLHPCYVKENFREELKLIYSYLSDAGTGAVAIGEIGLDFYWDLTFREQQEIALKEQFQWASELNLPVAIHSRNSTDEVIAILKELKSLNLKGVFHCFSGDMKQAETIIDLGFYLGIGGVVTFKNSGLDKIIAQLPLSNLLLETDGPYLAPAPFRGKRNEPSYLKLIAAKVSEIKGVSIEEISEITTANADRLFGLNRFSNDQ